LRLDREIVPRAIGSPGILEAGILPTELLSQQAGGTHKANGDHSVHHMLILKLKKAGWNQA
jgi:hypothetical protein